LNGYAGSRLADFELIIGNEDQFIQVFLNITKNAIEAMSTGGKLTVITSMSNLFNSVQADGGKYRPMTV
jgi:nitrogen-specific signal transduction histidine kinase